MSALAAEGKTEISDIYHIERGYYNIEKIAKNWSKYCKDDLRGKTSQVLFILLFIFGIYADIILMKQCLSFVLI